MLHICCFPNFQRINSSTCTKSGVMANISDASRNDFCKKKMFNNSCATESLKNRSKQEVDCETEIPKSLCKNISGTAIDESEDMTDLEPIAEGTGKNTEKELISIYIVPLNDTVGDWQSTISDPARRSPWPFAENEMLSQDDGNRNEDYHEVGLEEPQNRMINNCNFGMDMQFTGENKPYKDNDEASILSIEQDFRLWKNRFKSHSAPVTRRGSMATLPEEDARINKTRTCTAKSVNKARTNQTNTKHGMKNKCKDKRTTKNASEDSENNKDKTIATEENLTTGGKKGESSRQVERKLRARSQSLPILTNQEGSSVILGQQSLIDFL